MSFYSPLRYPGGKGKVADYFKQIFKDNMLYDGVYIEPYAGGASVALSLLFNQYASKVIINDIDRSIYCFWHSVLNETEELCRLINDIDVNTTNWNIQKEVQRVKHDETDLSVGFSTFFLNRTNRSGILKAGMIGGKEQAGNWKIDARFNKKDLIGRIETIAQYKHSIELHNSDAVQLVKNLTNKLPAKSLFYFDPPYFIKGKELYLNYYGSDDHQEIASELRNVVNQKWIVTYDNVDPIKALYRKYRTKEFQLNYSAGQLSKSGEEVMIFSDNVYISDLSMLEKGNKILQSI